MQSATPMAAAAYERLRRRRASAGVSGITPRVRHRAIDRSSADAARVAGEICSVFVCAIAGERAGAGGRACVEACTGVASALLVSAVAGVSTDASRRSGTVVAIEGASAEARVGAASSVTSRRRGERAADGSGDRSGVSSKRSDSAMGMLSRDTAGSTVFAGVGGGAVDVALGSGIAVVSDPAVASGVDASGAVVMDVGVSSTESDANVDGAWVVSRSLDATSAIASIGNGAPHW